MNILIINKADFDNVIQIAKHCTYAALTPYIRERQNLDLTNLLGNALYFFVLNNLKDAKVIELLNGSTFKDCNSNVIQHYGLKRVLIHLSYSAYVLENGYTDTPFGLVQKMHQDSVPVSMGELTNLSNRHKRIAGDYMEMTKNFICQNLDNLKNYIGDCDCFAKPIPTRVKTFKIIKKNGSNRDYKYRQCDF